MGFQTILGRVPERLKTKRRYKCLRFSEEGAKEVDQQYLVIKVRFGCLHGTSTVGIILLSTNTTSLEHFILFVKMIGKKTESSGLSDVLIEAGMIGSGWVISEKKTAVKLFIVLKLY